MSFFHQEPEDKKECPDQFKDKVKCAECLCWLDKDDAKIVTYYGVFGTYKNVYCKAHAPKYDEVQSWGSGNHYYGRCEVKKDGTPIIQKP